MAKVLVSLPAGYNGKLIMDSKDFAVMQDLFDKAVRVDERYLNGEYAYVEADEQTFVLRAQGLYSMPKVLTPAEHEALAKEVEA